MAYLEVVSPYLVYFTNLMHLKYDKRGALCMEWPYKTGALCIEWPYKSDSLS
jgi:hypothetical protein